MAKIYETSCSTSLMLDCQNQKEEVCGWLLDELSAIKRTYQTPLEPLQIEKPWLPHNLGLF